MTAFNQMGLQLAEHWRGLAEIAAGLAMLAVGLAVTAVIIASRSGSSRR